MKTMKGADIMNLFFSTLIQAFVITALFFILIGCIAAITHIDHFE